MNDYNRVFHTISNSLYNLLYVDDSWRKDTIHGPYIAQGKYMMLAEIMPKFRYIFAEKYKNLDFSLAIYQEICMMDPNLKPSKVDSLLSLVPSSLHSSPFYRDLKIKAEKIRTLGQGAVAPDFQLPTPDGQQVTLSSYRGKYLLLVFWASWCGPCREEIPHLMDIHEKYHADGLDILSVSVDNKKEAWEKALAESNMPWTQVSDLKGLKSCRGKTLRGTRCTRSLVDQCGWKNRGTQHSWRAIGYDAKRDFWPRINGNTEMQNEALSKPHSHF